VLAGLDALAVGVLVVAVVLVTVVVAPDVLRPLTSSHDTNPPFVGAPVCVIVPTYSHLLLPGLTTILSGPGEPGPHLATAHRALEREGRLTPGIDSAAGHDGELLVRPGRGKYEAFAVVELVRVVVAAELLAGSVQSAGFGCRVDDLLGAVARAAAGHRYEGAGASDRLGRGEGRKGRREKEQLHRRGVCDVSE
jgi:hypothetical protein